MLKNSWT